MPVEPRRVRSDDRAVEIAIHDLARSADEGAVPVLISHATGFNARTYQPIADALGAPFDIVGLDHRGHGYTRAPLGWVVDWAKFGDDTATVAATQWNGRAVTGFGHSMGAASLILAAAAHPDAFDRLVLFEPIAPSGFVPGDVDPEEQPLVVSARRRRDRFDSFASAIENYASKPPLGTFDPEALRNYVEYGFEPLDDGVTLRCRPEFESDTYASAASNGVWEAMPAVKTPTTIVAGRVEPSGPSAWATSIAERIEGATYVELPALNHFGPMDDPAAVADLIRDAVWPA